MHGKGEADDERKKQERERREMKVWKEEDGRGHTGEGGSHRQEEGEERRKLVRKESRRRENLIEVKK